MNGTIPPGPLLSVVVPVFNGMPHLSRATTSIVEAVDRLGGPDRSDVEIVISDNHSTDGTRDHLAGLRFQCDSRIISPSRHLARAAHWAYALGEARGRWLMMLHADDQLRPAALAAAILPAARKAQERGAVMITGRHERIGPDGQAEARRPRWPLPAVLSGARLREQVLPILCPFVPFSPFLRSSYLAAGGLNTEFELVQDWEFWIRLLSSGDVLYVPEVFGIWRTHEITGSYARTFALEHLEIARRLPELVPSVSRQTLTRADRAQRSRAAIWSSDDGRVGPAEASLRPLVRRAAAWLAIERGIGTARLLIRSVRDIGARRDHVRN